MKWFVSKQEFDNLKKAYSMLNDRFYDHIKLHNQLCHKIHFLMEKQKFICPVHGEIPYDKVYLKMHSINGADFICIQCSNNECIVKMV